MLGGRSLALEALKQQITALETRPVLAEQPMLAATASVLVPPPGVVHEIFADQLTDGGAALGFALAQARHLVTGSRPAILFLQMRADVQELGLPYGIGLEQFGLNPADLVLIRPQNIVELLWAIEEAVACRAVAAVVADIAYPHKALDFTASRRLSLRAAAAANSVFLVRYGRDREASAARFRWQIMPAPSRPPPFDVKAPGLPRWRVRLEKGSLGKRRKAAPDGEEFLVDWTENGFALVDIDGRSAARPQDAEALPDAASAALGYRLSQAG
jgi:protein ImuA